MEKIIPMNSSLIVHVNKKTKQKGITIPLYSGIEAGDRVVVYKVVDDDKS